MLNLKKSDSIKSLKDSLAVHYFNKSLSELNLPTIAEVTLRRPLTSAIPELNLITKPRDWASLTSSPSELGLVSIISDLILFL